MTPEQLQAWRWEREIDERNRPLSDEELDAMFPEGYKVITWNMNVSGFRMRILKFISQVCAGLALIYSCLSTFLVISKYICVLKHNRNEK